MTHAGTMRQLKALLLKNARLKLRNYVSTLVQIILPIALIGGLMAIRAEVGVTTRPADPLAKEMRLFRANDQLRCLRLSMNSKTKQTIAMSPSDSDFVRQLKASLEASINVGKPDSDIDIVLLDSSDDVDDYVKANDYGGEEKPPIVAAIAFDFLDFENNDFQYALRMNSSQWKVAAVPPTFMPAEFTLSDKYSPFAWKRFYHGGFLLLQSFVDEALAAYSVSRTVPLNPDLDDFAALPFPEPAGTDDVFASLIKRSVGMLYALILMAPIAVIVKSLCQERREGLESLLHLMGASYTSISAAWWLVELSIAVLTALVIACLGTATIFAHSSFTLVLIAFVVLLCATAAYANLVATLSRNSKSAVTIACVAWLLLYFAYQPTKDADTLPAMRILSSLALPAGFAHFQVALNELESAQIGARWSNLFEPVEGVSIGTLLLMMVLDGCLYFLLAVLAHMKLRTKRLAENSESLTPRTESENANISHPRGRVTLRVQDLDVRYGKDVHAVKSANFDACLDQVTAVIGENGAGKSSTMRTVLGQQKPSDGLIAFRVDEEIVGNAGLIGYCPQQNVLWDDLTVHEHLTLFAHVKCVQEVETAVQVSMEEVELAHKRNYKTKQLSGGQKRRLCLAMALLGDPKLVLLDEPTSGQDAYSRHATWELIRRKRRGRSMLLTTHFLEEAEELGDHVVVMRRGDVVGSGTSLFLKRAVFGDNSVVFRLASGGVIMEEVREVDESVEVLAESIRSVCFRCSGDRVGLVAALLEQAEISYAVSAISLEDVFLQLCSQPADSDTDTDTVDTDTDTVDTDTDTDGVKDQLISVTGDGTTDGDTDSDTAWHVALRQLRALVAKRARHARRDPKVWVWTIVYPLLVCLLGVGLIVWATRRFRFPQAPLSPGAHISLGSGDGRTHLYLEEPPHVPVALYKQSDLPTDGRNTDFAAVALSNAREEETVTFGVELDVAEPYNMSLYLLDQKPKWNADSVYSYGALAWSRQNRVRSSACFARRSNVDTETLMFNTTMRDSLPLTLNLRNNYRLRKSTSNQEARIVTVHHPLPTTKYEEMLGESIAVLAVALALSLAPASLAHTIRLEESVGFARQQKLAGVRKDMFWLAHFLWDMVNLMPPIALVILVSYAFGLKELTSSFGAFLLTLLLFAGAVVLLVHACCVTFLRGSSPASAQATLLVFLVLSGAVLQLVAAILDEIESTKATNGTLKALYRIFFPTYCMTESLTRLHLRALIRDTSTSAFAWKVSGRCLAYMGWHIVLYASIIFIAENVRIRRRHDTEHDHSAVQEVEQEALRVETSEDELRVQHLRKVYKGGKIAVVDLSFGVAKGECFGLLGVNGAGKTSTLKMLTGELLPTTGTATIAGFDLVLQPDECRRSLGYVPQHDALLPSLTPVQTLELFAGIRGCGGIDEMLHKTGLHKFRNTPAAALSGGNKRKLCLAVALLGRPSVLLVDEASTGVDSGARRELWQLLRQENCAIVLTTHQMDEAEELCDRVAIMVGGQLRCLGTVPELKCGKGLLVHASPAPSCTIDELTRALCEIIPNGTVVDSGSTVQMHVPTGASIPVLFGQLAAMSQVREYSVSNCSLEHVFVTLVRQHVADQTADDLAQLRAESTFVGDEYHRLQN